MNNVLNMFEDLEKDIKILEIDNTQQMYLINKLTDILIEFKQLKEENEKLERKNKNQEETISTLRIKNNMFENMLRGILEY